MQLSIEKEISFMWRGSVCEKNSMQNSGLSYWAVLVSCAGGIYDTSASG